MLLKVFFVITFGVCVLLHAQPATQQPISSVTDSVTKVTTRDTMSATVLSVADTSQHLLDTVVGPSTTSLVIDTIKSPTLVVTKKKYNHREQIVFATIMMLFIGVVISSAQNWNPD